MLQSTRVYNKMDKTEKNSNNHANQTKSDKFEILVMEQSWNKSQNSAENNQKILTGDGKMSPSWLCSNWTG